MKRKITDKTAGLTSLFPPRIIYTLSDREMTTDQIIREMLNQKATRTFTLSSLKEVLKRFNDKIQNFDEFAFLARHIAGGGHVLVKVVYKKLKRDEEFVITEIKYNDSKWPKGTFIAYAYD